MTDNQIKAKFIHYAANFLDNNMSDVLEYDEELATLYESSEEEQDMMWEILEEAQELIHELANRLL